MILTVSHPKFYDIIIISMKIYSIIQIYDIYDTDIDIYNQNRPPFPPPSRPPSKIY